MGNVPSFLNPFSGLTSKVNGNEYTTWRQHELPEELMTDDEDEPMEVNETEDDDDHQQLYDVQGMARQTLELAGQEMSPVNPQQQAQDSYEMSQLIDHAVDLSIVQENGANQGSEIRSQLYGSSLSARSFSLTGMPTGIPRLYGIYTRIMTQINRVTTGYRGRSETASTLRIIPGGRNVTTSVEGNSADMTGSGTQPPAHMLNLKATKNSGRFVCICGVRCKTMKSHKRHVEYSTTRGKFECGICKRNFIYLGHLTQHERQKHKNGRSSMGMGCRKCGFIFFAGVDLMFHYRHIHGYNQARNTSPEVPTVTDSPLVQPEVTAVPRPTRQENSGRGRKRTLAISTQHDGNAAKRFRARR